MSRHLTILKVILTLTFVFNFGNGQLKTGLIKCNNKETVATQRRQSKIIKNHFLSLPDEFLFVQCGLQDKAGNMWFGSAGNGIYFYDGTSFTNFTSSEDLNLNDILCCLQDKSGIIWFGSRRGLIRYKPFGTKPVETNFTTFKISENIISYSTHNKIPDTHEVNNNFVWSIFQDKSNKIWFGTN